jgi:uridine kinase
MSVSNVMQIKKNKLLIFLVLFKLLLLFFFNSGYNKGLFYPFISFFNGFNNPWDIAQIKSFTREAFPYHGLMLYIFKTFQFIGSFVDSIQLRYFIFKIPLFLADLLMLYSLIKLTKKNIRTIVLIYFANPIVLYSTYLIGQLDIIPMSLLLFGIVLLRSQRILMSSVIVGLTLSTKLNVLAALPLIFLFVKKKNSTLISFRYLMVCLSVFFVLDCPFLLSESFFNMVLNNPKQSVVFDSKYNIGSFEIYPTFLVLIYLYFYFYSLKKVNFDLLLTFMGILFSSLVFFVFPVSSWYIWFLPFIILFFVENLKDNYILFISFYITYFLFFVFGCRSEHEVLYYLGTKYEFLRFPDYITNILYTILEALILVILYGFYKFGIKSNNLYNSQTNFIIGIAGDSGSGKTMFTNQLNNLFLTNLLHLEGDGEHKWERGNKNWENLTHLDPKANNIHLQANHIVDLKNNKTIQRSDYKHDTGTFTDLIKIKPKEYIALSGLHPYYLPKMRKTIDLKIFLDTEETLRNFWKIKRDTKKRGYTIDKILEQIKFRKEDAIKYIVPQKNYSDLILNYYPVDEINLNYLDTEPKIGLKIYFDANIHIENFVKKLGLEDKWDYSEDLKYQYIDFAYEPNFNFKQLAEELITNLYEIIPSNAVWLDGFEGISQFFVVLIVSEKRKN